MAGQTGCHQAAERQGQVRCAGRTHRWGFGRGSWAQKEVGEGWGGGRCWKDHEWRDLQGPGGTLGVSGSRLEPRRGRGGLACRAQSSAAPRRLPRPRASDESGRRPQELSGALAGNEKAWASMVTEVGVAPGVGPETL